MFSFLLDGGRAPGDGGWATGLTPTGSASEEPLSFAQSKRGGMLEISPAVAAGVFLSTAATDAVYVFFNAAVAGRQRFRAASWSSLWYLLSAFAVISYTKNPVYAVVAAAGSWVGAFVSVSYLGRRDTERR